MPLTGVFLTRRDGPPGLTTGGEVRLCLIAGGPQRQSRTCSTSRLLGAGRIVDDMAKQQPLPQWPVGVDIQPAPGWVRIPRDPRPQGRFLKHDPCADVAQQLIRAGQVNKLMLRSTTDYIRRMSVDNLANLWLGTFIEAPSPQAMFIANMVVFPPVETPVAAGRRGEIDYEELRRRAETKKHDDESDHDVQAVGFSWGRGYRSSWTRPGGQHPAENGKLRIQYQVVSTATGSTIYVFSDVPAHGSRTGKAVEDIASMVAAMTPFLRTPGPSAEPGN